MTRPLHDPIDPTLDLVLERAIDLPREVLWRAWTTPEHLLPWFTPKPWRTVECQIDLRPGGIFRTVMESPEGEKFPHVGCYLDVVTHETFAWTSALGPGYRPIVGDTEVPVFTARLLFESQPNGTKYTAIVKHKDTADAKKHADMGFHDGWGAATEQLIAHAKTLGT